MHIVQSNAKKEKTDLSYKSKNWYQQSHYVLIMKFSEIDGSPTTVSPRITPPPFTLWRRAALRRRQQPFPSDRNHMKTLGKGLPSLAIQCQNWLCLVSLKLQITKKDLRLINCFITSSFGKVCYTATENHTSFSLTNRVSNKTLMKPQKSWPNTALTDTCRTKQPKQNHSLSGMIERTRCWAQTHDQSLPPKI